MVERLDKSSTIASRTLLAIDANGREFELTVAVGEPYEVSEREWACPVSVQGLHDRLRDIHGIDSWQALQLAYQLIAQLLSYFIEDGGRLFWAPASSNLPFTAASEEREPVALDELFPRPPAATPR
jgi:hypothetical protein